MIRLRKADGTATEVPDDFKFVELVNDVDKSVMMVLMQVGPGVLLRIQPGSVDASRYENLFRRLGIKFTPSMVERIAT